MTEAELFRLLRKIAEMLRSYTKDGKRSIGDSSKDWLNPFSYQTESGLYLELYFSTPYRIWTPWGAVTLTNVHGDWFTILPDLLQRLGAEMYRPIRRGKNDQDGPVYKLTKVDEIQLPPAIECDPAHLKRSSLMLIAWEGLKRQTKTQ